MSDMPRATWRVHLAREQPGRALAGILAFILVGVAVGVTQERGGFGVLAALVLFGSTATFWLPRRYALFDDRIEITPWGWRRPVVYPLRRFRSAFVDGSSVLLSTTDQPTGLGRFRGLTVYLGGENADLAARIVERIKG
jgi:hypothetical protein